MIIKETNHDSVAFNLYPNIIVKLSGGLDSATMLIALCDIIDKQDNKDEYKIYPLTVSKNGNHEGIPPLDKANPFPVVAEIIKYARSKYPNVKIFNTEKKKIKNWWKNDRSYVNEQTRLINVIVAKHALPPKSFIVYNGVTQNPNIDVSPFEKNPEAHRQQPRKEGWVKNTGSVYYERPSFAMEPFRNTDKRTVVSLADKLQVLDDLLKITRSCEGRREMTEDFTIECKDGPLKNDYVCWWCYEKEWALKNYVK